MREHPVPCVNATHFEASQGKHLTWQDDPMCTRCLRILNMFAERRMLNEQFENEDESNLV